MIATNKCYPIIGLAKKPCIFVVNLLIVCRLVKSETAIPGYNEQSVSHLILLAHLIGKCMKVPVDISADNHALRFGIFEQFVHTISNLVIIGGR